MSKLITRFKIRWSIHLPLFAVLLASSTWLLFAFFGTGGSLSEEYLAANRIAFWVGLTIVAHLVWMGGLTLRCIFAEYWLAAIFGFVIGLAEYGLFRIVEFVYTLSLGFGL